MSSSTSSSPSSTKSVPTPSSSGKRRHHYASPYYRYCLDFIEQCAKNGRRFRTEKQGFEAAALKWNTLSIEQKDEWRERFRAERKKCIEEGTTEQLKLRNGDRGDPNADPTALGVLKDLNLKREKDIEALTMRWMWSYPDKEDFQRQPFFVVSAKPAPNGSFSALALVEFTLADGITDQFHARFCSDAMGSMIDAKYEAVRRVLLWPARVNRRLGDGPVFFIPPGQMAGVFDALTFVDQAASTSSPPWGDPASQVSLTHDIAYVDDLRIALCDYFKKPRLGSTSRAFQEEILDCCLITARQCAGQILDEFTQLESE